MKNNVIKGKKGQQLNQREAQLINASSVEGLLLFTTDVNNDAVTLTYNTDGLVSLPEFFKMVSVGKRLFVVLMRNISLAMKNVEENKFSKNLVKWDINTTYVEPSSWHVYLTYVPLQPYEMEGDLKSFLQETVSLCNFVSAEDAACAKTLIEEMNASVAYTAGMLDAYCDKLSGELAAERKVAQKDVCPACKAALKPNDRFCPHCGAATAVKEEPKPVQKAVCPSCKATLKPNDRFCPYCGASNPAAQGVMDKNGVVAVFQTGKATAQTIWLEEVGKSNKIPVGKFPFRIGKMAGVTDYRVLKTTVSRKHADIVKEQGKFFVVDLNSTNGTYLNGKKVQAGVKDELTNGAALRLADTEFKVHID